MSFNQQSERFQEKIELECSIFSSTSREISTTTSKPWVMKISNGIGKMSQFHWSLVAMVHQNSSGPPINTVQMKMNYHVEGKQQSPMEIVVMKDGKELKLGKDVNAQVTGDSINLSVINPRRDKSGIYTVVVKNAQGQSSKDILVNIMDKPTPPASVKVTDVFYDNCIV